LADVIDAASEEGAKTEAESLGKLAEKAFKKIE